MTNVCHSTVINLLVISHEGFLVMLGRQTDRLTAVGWMDCFGQVERQTHMARQMHRHANECTGIEMNGELDRQTGGQGDLCTVIVRHMNTQTYRVIGIKAEL